VKCLNSSSVFQINFSAGLTVLCPEIPHERQAQKRYQLVSHINLITPKKLLQKHPAMNPLVLTIDNEQYKVTSLTELNTLLQNTKNKAHIEYSITGPGETSIIVLMNSNFAMGTYFRFSGDSGLTTHNPNGNEDVEYFTLANGQEDEYPQSLLVDKQQGYEILTHYFLTGENYNRVEWIEE
jgi:hypothetical protein